MAFKVPIGYAIKGENTEVVYDDESTWVWSDVEDKHEPIPDDPVDPDEPDDRTWETVYEDNVDIISGSPNYIYEVGFDTPILEGETYRVTWGENTEPYICDTFAYAGAYTGYAFGNQLFIGGEDSGEPFFLQKGEKDIIMGGTSSNVGSLYLLIEKEVV